jgi:hypothetical protein
MNDDRDQQLAQRLLAEDGLGRDEAPGGGEARGGDAWLAALLAQERAIEARVRRVAVGAWSVVAALVPLLGIAFFIRRVGGGLSVEVIRAVAIVAGIFAILAFVIAMMTTVAWLFRSRAASLAVLARRLAALEELLRRER